MPQTRNQKTFSTPFFGALGGALLRNGWNVAPVNPMEPGVRPSRTGRPDASRPPHPADVEDWERLFPHHQVGVVMGPASGDAVALDVVMPNATLLAAALARAARILGATPLRATLGEQRCLLVYRDAFEGRTGPRPLPSLRLLAEGGTGGVALHGAGEVPVFYGRHHETGELWRWRGRGPLSLGPEAAPLVTGAQASAFLEAVHALCGDALAEIPR